MVKKSILLKPSLRHSHITADATPQHPLSNPKLLRRCGKLTDSNSLLDDFTEAARSAGLVGEIRNAKILLLAIISRVIDRPVSVVVKGARSGGKNTLVEAVLKFFERDAYYELTAMSEKAIAYFSQPLKNRTLVVTEAAGIKKGGDLFLRSLLSEGRISYETVSGGKTRKVELEGPTGLILTTTEVKLYEDDETRLISIDISETAPHTRKVLMAIGHAFAHPEKRRHRRPPDAWLALLKWIAIKPPRVKIPFAESISSLMSDADTRLYRDINALLGLVCAHALLHRGRRKTDRLGHLLATIDDYKAVRGLLHDIIARGIEAAVSPSVRRVVNAVEQLSNGATGVSGRDLVVHLGINKAGISRHVKAAIGLCYLRNLEEGKGKAARYVIGDAMPSDTSVIPTSKAVALHHRKRVANLKVKAA